MDLLRLPQLLAAAVAAVLIVGAIALASALDAGGAGASLAIIVSVGAGGLLFFRTLPR